MAASTVDQTNLQIAVGAAVDVLPADFDAAQLLEQTQWAFDGFNWLVQIAEPEELKDVLTATASATIPDGALRLVYVVDASSDYATYRPPLEFEQIKAAFGLTTEVFGTGKRVYTVVGKTIEIYPSEVPANNYTVLAPTALPFTVPAGWDSLIYDYAATKAKMKDEEAQQASALWQMFVTKVSRFPGLRPQAGGQNG